MLVGYVRDSTLVADPKWSVSSVTTSDACRVAEEMSEEVSEAGQERDDPKLPCQVNGSTTTSGISIIENSAGQLLWYIFGRACLGMGSRIAPKELELFNLATVKTETSRGELES